MTRAIVLHGQPRSTEAAYLVLDAMLRDRKVTDVALIQTTDMTQAAAQQIRERGSVLWYCGADLTPAQGGGSTVQSDQYLLADSFEHLAPKVIFAFNDYMGTAGVRS